MVDESRAARCPGPEGRAHGVGGVHAAAGAGAGDGVLLDVLEFLVADLARGVLTHGLEDAHDACGPGPFLNYLAGWCHIHVDGRHWRAACP